MYMHVCTELVRAPCCVFSFDMRPRQDSNSDYDSRTSEGYYSLSSDIDKIDSSAPKVTNEEKLKAIDEATVPHHHFTHKLGGYMEESISPSVPFLEITSLNTWDDAIRTELDSHANMVVLGHHCRLEDPDAPLPGTPDSTYAIVSAFSPDHKPMKIQVVDACIGYWCPVNETTYILHFNDVLFVPSMEHNLIPPFILREAGFIVNDIPRIQCQNVIAT